MILIVIPFLIVYLPWACAVFCALYPPDVCSRFVNIKAINFPPSSVEHEKILELVLVNRLAIEGLKEVVNTRYVSLKEFFSNHFYAFSTFWNTDKIILEYKPTRPPSAGVAGMTFTAKLLKNLSPIKITGLVAPGALAHRLQCRTACKIQNGC